MKTARGNQVKVIIKSVERKKKPKEKRMILKNRSLKNKEEDQELLLPLIFVLFKPVFKFENQEKQREE